MQPEHSSKTYVLYHARCYDGFAAAYAAWLVLGESAEYIPVNYQEPPPELADGARLFILDFSYPRSVLLELRQRMAAVVVLDHHAGAERELAGLDSCHFDNSKSGAVLAWNYFHPSLPTPALLEYIEDRDLWRWQLPYSREVSAGLRLYPFDFRVWDTLNTSSLITEGSAVMRYQEQLIKAAVARASPEPLGAWQGIPTVNATCLWSEIGEALVAEYPDAPFAAVWDERTNKQGDAVRQYSLRSAKGGQDVSVVAKQWGGGGHVNAAGFSIVLNKEPLYVVDCATS
jgi:oligoribonuclease NrnB/cAMP/cGMP phosphodiesterase (DHH superfamily)